MCIRDRSNSLGAAPYIPAHLFIPQIVLCTGGSVRSLGIDHQLLMEDVYKRQAVHMDKRILVALALDTALALGKVSRSPRTVQVMKCHQTVLHIGACAHLGGAAQKLSLIHI